MKPKVDSSLLQAPPKPNPEVLIRWATEKYPQRSQDMSDWLFSYYFWKEWDDPKKRGYLKEEEVMARAAAHAHMIALDNTNALGNIVEESIVLQLLYAEKTQWYRYEEVDDIRHLIEEKVIEQLAREDLKKQRAEAEGRVYKRGGKYFEYLNLLKVINTLEKMGVPKEDIIPVAPNFSKAVRAAPVIMSALENTSVPEPKRLEEVQNILREVADPKITVTTFEENNRKRTGKIYNAPDPTPGSILLAQQKEVLIIEATPGHAAAIKGALKGIVDFSITDGAHLLKQISQLVLPHSNGLSQVSLCTDSKGPKFEHGNGTLFPTPDAMETEILLTLARNENVIRQFLEIGQQSQYPVYEISSRITGLDVAADIAQAAFRYPEKDVFWALQEALKRDYHVPVEASNMFGCAMYLELGWDERSQVFGVFLQVVP